MIPHYGEMKVLGAVPQEPEAVSLSSITRKTGMAYAYVKKTIDEAEMYGMVRTKKIGRVRLVSRTQDGYLVVDRWLKFLDEYNRVKKVEPDPKLRNMVGKNL